MNLAVVGIGILTGIAFAAPPGAVTVETLRRGVRGGFGTAFGVQMGSLVGDAAYAVLALAGLAAIGQNPVLQLGLGLVGAVVLGCLAWSALTSARAAAPVPASMDAAAERRGAFTAGLAISLTNPWAVAFWLSLGGVVASLGLAQAGTRDTAIFFASFMLGSAAWAFALSGAIARLRGWAHPMFLRSAYVLCGLALGGFGLVLAGRIISSVLIR